MALLERLRKIAQTLRIIHVAPAGTADSAGAAAATGHAKIETRSLTLAELMSEIRQDEVLALAQTPAELTVPLEKVCEAAGVKPPANQWTIDKLRDVLRGDKYKSLAREPAQRALIAQLSAEKVNVEDVVKDAVARDQALDAFEQFVRDKMRSRLTARQSQLDTLQGQIHELSEQITRLKRDEDTEEQQWQQWQTKKKAYEKEMAWAIGYLLDKPIITTEDQ